MELLAERPRSVGELAELIGLRQPQTTKHLQTLARAGLVTVFPLGQRRVYAIETAPLTILGGPVARPGRDGLGACGRARRRRALPRGHRGGVRGSGPGGWADGRAFSFERVLAAPRDVVWRHWVEADLLASWWAPPSMTVTECLLEPRPGGRAVLEFRDAEGRYRSEGTVRTAKESESLVFDLSVLDAAGAVSFTGHYDLKLTRVDDGTRLRLGLRITNTTVEAMPYIAGIETGWRQVLDNLADRVGAFQRTTQIRPKEKERNHDQIERAQGDCEPGLTLDGRYHGPGGPGDLGAIVPYAITEVARNHLTRTWETRDDGASRPAQCRGVPRVLAVGRRRRECRSA